MISLLKYNILLIKSFCEKKVGLGIQRIYIQYAVFSVLSECMYKTEELH